ncbi:MAG: spore coat associated protein CotJA [Clostridia bacterium]|nr:spore coat associated protein CotJA [Clostridia bacterium]
MEYKNMVVGYAYVPPQTDCEMYTPEEALKCGTLFPELALSMCEYLEGVKEDKCCD